MSANLRRPTSLASLQDVKVQYFIMPSFIIKQALIHCHQIIHFMYVYRSNEIPLIQVAAYKYRLVGLEISLLFNSRRDIHYNNIPLTKRLTEDFLFNQQIHKPSNCSFSHRFRRPHNLVFTELVHDLSSVLYYPVIGKKPTSAQYTRKVSATWPVTTDPLASPALYANSWNISSQAT